MKTKRIKWIDIYKGIAIILMVIGHTYSPWVPYIYLFHMPAFIFISGFTTSFDKYKTVDFIKARAKALLIPYLCINIFYIFLRFMLQLLKIEPLFYQDAMHLKQQSIFFVQNLSTIDLGGATWFLVVLFEIAIISLIIDRIRKKIKLPLVINVVISLAMLIVMYRFYHQQRYLPYYLDMAIGGCFYYLLGHYIKEKKILTQINIYWGLPISAFFIYFFGKLNYIPMNWPTRTFATPAENIIAVISGIYLLYIISIAIERYSKIGTNALQYVGRKSIHILVLHFLIFRISFLMMYLLGYTDKEMIKELIPRPGNQYWLLISIASIIFIIIIDIFFHKNRIYSYALTGKTPLEYNFNNHTFALLNVLTITIIVSLWVITNKNGFVFDDYAWLQKAHFRTYNQLFSLIPQTRYNDRPVGAVLIKILYNKFGLDYIKHHMVLLLFHIANTIMVYTLVRKIIQHLKIKNAEYLPIIAMAWFGIYPKSLMAIQWDASIFDLLGATFVLTIMNLYVSTLIDDKYKYFNSTLIVAFYILALRTKEMTITIPVILILYYLISNTINKDRTLQPTPKIKRLDIVLLIIMAIYGFYVNRLSSIENITEDINNPYFISFNPFNIIRNFIRYCSLYFNYENSSFVFEKFTILSSIPIIVFFAIFIGAIYQLIKKKSYQLLSLYIIIVISFSPVLIMRNMQHILYLYIPSIFISILIAISINYIIVKLFKTDSNRYKIILVLPIALLLLSITPGIKTFRDYWGAVSANNQITMNELYQIPKPEEGTHIYVQNVKDNYHIFYYGPGFINQIIFNDETLTIEINPTEIDESKPYLILDYHEGHIREIKRKGSS